MRNSIGAAERSCSSDRRRAAARSLAMGVAVGIGGWLVGGCGHPASKEECQEIFDRSAAIELELQKVTDPELIKQRVAAARADKGEELMGKCVGKRITDRAVRCVREATTSKELDACLM
jgi:hypothetical protein